MIGKLVVDFDEVDLEELISLLSKHNFQCCIDDNCIYLYNNAGKQYAFSNIMRENKIQKYFSKELKNAPTKTPTNYVQTWFLEKFQSKN